MPSQLCLSVGPNQTVSNKRTTDRTVQHKSYSHRLGLLSSFIPICQIGRILLPHGETKIVPFHWVSRLCKDETWSSVEREFQHEIPGHVAFKSVYLLFVLIFREIFFLCLSLDISGKERHGDEAKAQNGLQ